VLGVDVPAPLSHARLAAGSGLSGHGGKPPRMTVAIVGLLGAVLGVLVGGGVQVGIARIERRSAARNAARLLWADHALALELVGSMVRRGQWWSDESAPTTANWHRYREALAGAIWGPGFVWVDGAFFAVDALERSRRDGVEAKDRAGAGRDAIKDLEEAGVILMRKGYRRKERIVMEDMYSRRSEPDGISPNTEG
jgi:hypothetical protein